MSSPTPIWTGLQRSLTFPRRFSLKELLSSSCAVLSLTLAPLALAEEPNPPALTHPRAEASLSKKAHTPIGLSPLHISTSTWSRFESRSGYEALGVARERFQEGNSVFYRARLGLRTSALQLSPGLRATIHFTPQVGGKWGLHDSTEEAELGVHEAFFRVHGKQGSFEAGRLFLSYGEGRLIGGYNWHENGRAFDGARARWSFGRAFLDGFFTLTRPSGLGLGHSAHAGQEQSATPRYFWGLYAGLGPLLGKRLQLDTYLLGLSQFAASAPESSSTHAERDATELTWGARFKQTTQHFDYRVEAGVQLGHRARASAPALTQSVFAYHADAELGLTFAPRFRLAFQAAIASGDDPNTERNESWNELFPSTHQFLGLMDVIGVRSNIAHGALHLTAPLTGSLDAALDAHVFSRLQSGGLGQVGESLFAGYEMDAHLDQHIGRFGHLRGLYGLFLPSEQHYVTSQAAHYVELQGGIVF